MTMRPLGAQFKIGIGKRPKTISWDAIVIFQIKDGKIVEEWVNRDELGALLTAGILKPN
jgi:predicted ester cyclase